MAYDDKNKYPAGGTQGGPRTPHGGSGDPLLDKLLGFTETSLNHPMWNQFLTNAKTDFAYREDDSWTKEELKELEARGQAPTKENVIHPLVEKLIGQKRSQKTRISFKGRTTPPIPRQAKSSLT